jgi:hypothetical protein
MVCQRISSITEPARRPCPQRAAGSGTSIAVRQFRILARPGASPGTRGAEAPRPADAAHGVDRRQRFLPTGRGNCRPSRVLRIDSLSMAMRPGVRPGRVPPPRLTALPSGPRTRLRGGVHVADRGVHDGRIRASTIARNRQSDAKSKPGGRSGPRPCRLVRPAHRVRTRLLKIRREHIVVRTIGHMAAETLFHRVVDDRLARIAS